MFYEILTYKIYFYHSIKYVKMKLHGVFIALCYCSLFLYFSAIFRKTERETFFDKAIRGFLWTKSFFLVGLLTGTVPLRTFKTHSQMVLTKASSATFKMALR